MSIGAQLRSAREAKGWSLGAVADRTRVQARILSAIELNDLSALPPPPFNRGFVRAYAAEVGLDPERTAREYFAQFGGVSGSSAPAPPPREIVTPDVNLPSHWGGLASAATILALVVVAAVVLGRRSLSDKDVNVVGTSGATAPATPATQPAPPAVETAPVQPAASPTTSAAPPPAQTGALNLTLSVTRPCWITASVDGVRKIYRTLQTGEQETLTAQRDIVLRIGDAAAVTWTLNGRQGASLGAPGAIRDIRITPENAATVR